MHKIKNLGENKEPKKQEEDEDDDDEEEEEEEESSLQTELISPKLIFSVPINQIQSEKLAIK
jgi:hypothetical protein